jgi:hypothetical protein
LAFEESALQTVAILDEKVKLVQNHSALKQICTLVPFKFVPGEKISHSRRMGSRDPHHRSNLRAKAAFREDDNDHNGY